MSGTFSFVLYRVQFFFMWPRALLWLLVCGRLTHGDAARASRPERKTPPTAITTPRRTATEFRANPSPHNASLAMFSAAEYPHARCLDGSQFGAYIRTAPMNASAESKSSWLVRVTAGPC